MSLTPCVLCLHTVCAPNYVGTAPTSCNRCDENSFVWSESDPIPSASSPCHECWPNNRKSPTGFGPGYTAACTGTQHLLNVNKVARHSSSSSATGSLLCKGAHVNVVACSQSLAVCRNLTTSVWQPNMGSSLLEASAQPIPVSSMQFWVVVHTNCEM